MVQEDPDMEGKLTSLSVVTAGGASSGSFSDTDSIDYEIHVGKDAETVLEDIKDGATALLSGTITGTGRANRIRSRARGAYMGIKIGNDSASETWAIETIVGNIKPAGRIK